MNFITSDAEAALILVALEMAIFNWKKFVKSEDYPPGFDERTSHETLRRYKDLYERFKFEYQSYLVKETIKEDLSGLEMEDIFGHFGPQGSQGENDDDDWN